MRESLRRLVLVVIVWNLLVVGWGAFVRATGSGAGCGAHWPLCDGEVIPRAPSAERMIEWTHRATSGLALVAGVWLVVAACRRRPKGHPMRRAAWWSLGFLLAEAALGAGLVLFELVGDNDSATRAVVMALHLVNTFLLFAALALTLHHADDDRPLRWPREGPRRGLARRLLVALALLLLTGASGAIAALGDTLFPASSLLEGFAQDLSPTAHALLRLRVFHPFFAVAAAVAVLLLAYGAASHLDDPRAVRRARWAGGLALAEVALGVVNLGLLAPVALQLAHLLLADLLWIAVVLTGASLLRAASPAREPGALAG
jgi:cytochrome c oxidase assembly protein subunit 15